MFKSGQWTDCTFLVGSEDQEGGHKAILASASPVFAAMFYGELAERQSPIPIPDIQPETFRAMLTYIYAQQDLEVNSVDIASNLYYAAQKYALIFIKDICVNFMDSYLDGDNYDHVCQIYEFASLYDENTIITKCLKVIEEKTGHVVEGCSFIVAELRTVAKIFSLQRLAVNELKLFKALERYVEARKPVNVESEAESGPQSSGDRPTETELKSITRILLEKIRFLDMSASQFALGPAVSGLLTESEILAILMNIVTPESPIPMPRGFCTSRESRY